MKSKRTGILLLVFLVTSCAQLSSKIEDAPFKHAKAVVFDIDGTLTPTVLKYRSVRPDAARAVHVFADQGRKIIYLTARILPLQAGIPEWLKENGFPEGSIHVTESLDDMGDHAQFKKKVLREFVAHGWEIEFAYGDSSSDFEAYLDIGISREHVFALRREGDDQCQPGVWKACLNGWTEHIEVMTKFASTANPQPGSSECMQC